MKKIFSLIIGLTIMVFSLFGCNTTPSHFSGEWKFSEVDKVEFVPNLSQEDLDSLKQQYNADDEAGILTNALAYFADDENIADFYLRFEKEYTYTYDPFADREATWFFYQTGENEGFISFDGYLEANNGNPDSVVYPDIVYKKDTNTMYIAINNYGSFMITLELTR